MPKKKRKKDFRKEKKKNSKKKNQKIEIIFLRKEKERLEELLERNLKRTTNIRSIKSKTRKRKGEKARVIEKEIKYEVRQHPYQRRYYRIQRESSIAEGENFVSYSGVKIASEKVSQDLSDDASISIASYIEEQTERKTRQPLIGGIHETPQKEATYTHETGVHVPNMKVEKNYEQHNQGHSHRYPCGGVLRVFYHRLRNERRSGFGAFLHIPSLDTIIATSTRKHKTYHGFR